MGCAVGIAGVWVCDGCSALVVRPWKTTALLALAAILALYGLATVAHGSGFLAVLIAGIVLGDTVSDEARTVEGFHSTLASIGEVVAFVMLASRSACTLCSNTTHGSSVSAFSRYLRSCFGRSCARRS